MKGWVCERFRWKEVWWFLSFFFFLSLIAFVDN